MDDESSADAGGDLPPALFLPTSQDGEHSWTVTATQLSKGPWGHGVMHGGAICGLAAWGIERTLGRDDLVCTRLTVEILSGVPIVELGVSGRVVKSGRNTAVAESAITDGDRVVVRASSQWMAATVQGLPAPAVVPPRPVVAADPGAHPDIEYPRPGFNADAVEQRILSGSTEEPGPGLMWLRLAHPLMDGEVASPFQQIATLSDLGAAVGWDDCDHGTYINTDVTLQLLRTPVGPWVLFDSETVQSGAGLACCRSTLADQAGLLGWVLQSQMIAPVAIATPFS